MSIPNWFAALFVWAFLAFGCKATQGKAMCCVRVLEPGSGSTAKAMSAPTVDRARLCRLFLFIREHEEQARTAGDDVRTDKWERLVDKLLDRMPRERSSA